MKTTHVTMTIWPEGLTHRDKHSKRPPLKFLQEAVGGYIEAVPHLTSITLDGKKRRCIAYANENGRIEKLPLNEVATNMWLAALGPGPFRYEPQLFGPVVFVMTAVQARGLL